MGDEWYADRGIEVCETDRGGRVTYHGPGQLVAYPVMEVERVADFVHTMEAAIVAALRDEGIESEPREHPHTGIWAGDAKIASIGVRVSGGVSTHGLAVNVDNDLTPFEWIVPCGIDHVRMTSLAKETGRTRSLPCFRKRLAWHFAEAFGRASGSCRSGVCSTACRWRREHRSRSIPVARVLDMGEVRPFRERKPAWFNAQRPAGRAASCVG